MRVKVIAAFLAVATCWSANASPVSESYGYDRSGRLVCTDYTSAGGPADDDAVQFSYDRSDNRLKSKRSETGGLCNLCADAVPDPKASLGVGGGERVLRAVSRTLALELKSSRT